MAVKLVKRRDLGPGVSSYEFRIQRDPDQHVVVYNQGRDIEKRVSFRVRKTVNVPVERSSQTDKGEK